MNGLPRSLTGAVKMTDQEKDVLHNERKQIKGLLEAIRTENNVIRKHLTSMISFIETTRASQLGIDIMISDLEEKLK